MNQLFSPHGIPVKGTRKSAPSGVDKNPRESFSSPLFFLYIKLRLEQGGSSSSLSLFLLFFFL